MVISAFRVTVNFDATELTPKNSFVDRFFEANDLDFAENGGDIPWAIYIHDVDASDPRVQKEIVSFISNLMELPHIRNPPNHFWITDFQDFTSDLGNITFNDQLELFLQQDEYRSL